MAEWSSPGSLQGLCFRGAHVSLAPHPYLPEARARLPQNTEPGHLRRRLSCTQGFRHLQWHQLLLVWPLCKYRPVVTAFRPCPDALAAGPSLAPCTGVLVGLGP